MISKVYYFFALSRLRFLVYSPILYTIGVMIAQFEHSLPVEPYCFVVGLIFVLNTHMMTHYFNEYYDYEADCNNQNPSPWTGGSRILVNKKMARKTSLRIGYVSGFISFSLLCVIAPDVHSFCYGIMIIVLAWGYSGWPLKLEYRGLGELDVALVLNILVPLFGYRLQFGEYRASYLLLLLLPLAAIEHARMMIMNMPDRVSDEKVGKKTFVVRIGILRSIHVYTVINTIAYCSLVLFWGKVAHIILLLLLCSAILCIWIIYRLYKGDWQDYKRMYYIPFWASTHNGLSAACFLLGLIFTQRTDFSYTSIQMYPLYLYAVSLLFFSIPLIKRSHY
jgi:1,4-dihydroxy-2-naphthoate octaprenyltransferase